MNKTILFVAIPLILIFAIAVIGEIISQERNARKKAEQELQTTRKSLKQ